MPPVRIALAEPFAFRGEAALDAVTVRPPTGADYFALSDPVEFARTPGGSIIATEREDRIAAYAERLVEPAGAAERLGLADAMRVKDAILGFFNEARAPTPPAPSTSSSST